MENDKATYLAHLEDSIPEGISGYSLGMYCVALEGWRRGLTLKFINNNRKKSELDYSLTLKDKTHYFTVTRGDAVPRSAIKACINKNITKDYLLKAGVPTPKGDTFGEENSDEEIIHYANQLGYPVVLKPSDGTGGRGVIANIKNESEFKEALSFVKYDLKFVKLIVEQYAKGEDYRINVIGDKVVAALKKIPANVIGDGKNDISTLIKRKNKQRKTVPALSDKPIKVDKETHNILKASGYTIDSVPPKGERIFLKTKNNISSGGDSIDITDELSDHIKEIAVNACKAIPGLVQCGLDMMVDEERDIGTVIEVNSRPHINSQLYPMEGKARDIPKEVIDYYFPETVQPDYSKGPNYFFEFKSIFETFQNGTCKVFTVPDCPSGDLTSTRFILEGKFGIKFEKWIQKQALRLRLNGYLKYITNSRISVVISGPTESVDKFRKMLNQDGSAKAEVGNVEEKTRNKPVKVGFEIKGSPFASGELKKGNDVKEDGYHPVYFDYSTAKQTRGSKKKRKKGNNKGTSDLTLKQERDFYKKKYEEVLNSTSWKLTKPIRAIGRLLKK
ncbi:ATP-grasp domain-containing protein [Oceanobacillus halotolerans]|uniref:ATP-grasp domain-containing protein n=1 Tax=Oceanobacillus halotolerans TaxID=2663380 RepID=UPI0013DD2E87|nr:ATP-grasp domain-containing protein [Oceanobacillus halotolerans]